MACVSSLAKDITDCKIAAGKMHLSTIISTSLCVSLQHGYIFCCLHQNLCVGHVVIVGSCVSTLVGLYPPFIVRPDPISAFSFSLLTRIQSPSLASSANCKQSSCCSDENSNAQYSSIVLCITFCIPYTFVTIALSQVKIFIIPST